MQQFTAILTKFDLGVVGKEYILALDVTVYNTVAVQMGQTTQYLATHICNPLDAERVSAHSLDEFCDRSSSAELHYQPQLVILPVNTLTDKRAIICCYVPVM